MYGLSIQILDIEQAFESNIIRTNTAGKRIAKRLELVIQVAAGNRYETKLNQLKKEFETNASNDNLRCLIFELKEFMVVV